MASVLKSKVNGKMEIEKFQIIHQSREDYRNSGNSQKRKIDENNWKDERV